jgi:hypothetical protein
VVERLATGFVAVDDDLDARLRGPDSRLIRVAPTALLHTAATPSAPAVVTTVVEERDPDGPANGIQSLDAACASTADTILVPRSERAAIRRWITTARAANFSFEVVWITLWLRAALYFRPRQGVANERFERGSQDLVP